MDDNTIKKVIKILSLISSDKEGEVIHAIKKADDLLRKNGSSLTEFLASKSIEIDKINKRKASYQLAIMRKQIKSLKDVLIRTRDRLTETPSDYRLITHMSSRIISEIEGSLRAIDSVYH